MNDAIFDRSSQKNGNRKSLLFPTSPEFAGEPLRLFSPFSAEEAAAGSNSVDALRRGDCVRASPRASMAKVAVWRKRDTAPPSDSTGRTCKSSARPVCDHFRQEETRPYEFSTKVSAHGEKPASAEVEERTLLVTFIRETLRLTGTHVGCDTAQCGACTVQHERPAR